MIQDSQVPALFVIYSIGYTAVFAIFAWMNRYAYRKREVLQLNEYEVLRTRHAVVAHSGYAAVGIVVVLAASLLPTRMMPAAGFLFFLNAVHRFISGSVFGKREKLALERMLAWSFASKQSSKRFQARF